MHGSILLAYICSNENNRGMHKCDNLPNYKEAGVECLLTVEEAHRGARGCVNWNQVLMFIWKNVILIFSTSGKSAEGTYVTSDIIFVFLRLLM